MLNELITLAPREQEVERGRNERAGNHGEGEEAKKWNGREYLSKKENLKRNGGWEAMERARSRRGKERRVEPWSKRQPARSRTGENPWSKK
jgi:hypothetical protein